MSAASPRGPESPSAETTAGSPPATGSDDAERARVATIAGGRAPWRHFGPYLSERAWGTVREDYSADGDAWAYFPFEHARSRAFRWSEDGLAGICDVDQYLCLALALWNGADPILKERVFGLSNGQGNHGEDAKDYWWFLDSTPTHSWLRWRYHYPQREFPYADLLATNAKRGRDDPEYELADTGIFDDDRYFAVTVDYAKAAPHDICMAITVENKGPDAATLHVLPTLWFRNTWAWGRPGPQRPVISCRAATAAGDLARLAARHEELGGYVLTGAAGPDGVAPTPLACDNETNTELLYGVLGNSEYPKDGIGDHVVHGAAAVNPDGTGTKAALWYRLSIPAGGTVTLRLRFAAGDDGAGPDLGAGWERVLHDREREADAYYAALLPASLSADEASVARQALAGMLWSKQFYHYDVTDWLDGDPTGPTPPAQRLAARNHTWRHLDNRDIISMPDTWEYPWYAAWDLAFHTVALAHVDPEFAKNQLLLLCRVWFMHPNGQLPAYEWNFSDTNPPVHAWAALRVFEIDGSRDVEFLERIFHKLLVNFTWWVNRKDAEGNDVFEGGFLGLDNIGAFNRSLLPVQGIMEQTDGTAWMAMFALNMLEIALVLARNDQTYADIATKFAEHFFYIADALDDCGLWDEEDGFFYDVLRCPDGVQVPMKVRSMVGLLPLVAVLRLGCETFDAIPDFGKRIRWFLANKRQLTSACVTGLRQPGSDEEDLLLAVVGPDRLRRLLAPVLDEGELLSAHGLRALSARHRDHPFTVTVQGERATVDYEPAESRTGLFGGNSNWRGPVWFPLNVLLLESLYRYDAELGPAFTVELPTGSGNQVRLAAVADELRRRLVGIFLLDDAGRRPVFGGSPLLQRPPWRDQLLFHEYFHGDTGAGLGASHQTGWTGLVADLLLRRRPAS